MRMILYAVACAVAMPIAAFAQVDKPADYSIPAESPSAAQARVRLKEGQKLMAEDAYEEAAKAFQEAATLDPLLMMAHYGLGTARMAKKEYAAAVTAFEAARDAFDKRLAQDSNLRQRGQSSRESRIQ